MDTKSVNKVDTVASSVWEPSFLYFCLLFEALAPKEMARVTVKLPMARFLVACTLLLLTQLVELTLRGQTKQSTQQLSEPHSSLPGESLL